MGWNMRALSSTRTPAMKLFPWRGVVMPQASPVAAACANRRRDGVKKKKHEALAVWMPRCISPQDTPAEHPPLRAKHSFARKLVPKQRLCENDEFEQEATEVTESEESNFISVSSVSFCFHTVSEFGNEGFGWG